MSAHQFGSTAIFENQGNVRCQTHAGKDTRMASDHANDQRGDTPTRWTKADAPPVRHGWGVVAETKR